VRYARDVTADVLRDRLHRFGFGVGTRAEPMTPYELKASPRSSHGVLLSWLSNTKPGLVLDVGCSDGSFGELVRAQGHRVVGVDVIKHEGVGDRLDGFVEANLNEGLPVEIDDQFDSIVAGDVLEHTIDPGALLDDLARHLTPGGSLFVSVPNFAHWYPRTRVAVGRFDYDARGILDSGHIRFFTRRSFERLLAEHGLAIVRRDVVGSPIELLERDESSTLGRLARIAGKVDRLATRVWPTMFGYQFLYELRQV
jgi:2-polyprenyl-3-methyl-5-hydroxy-6-metoxy-1,4-benzoquinol methylase